MIRRWGTALALVAALASACSTESEVEGSPARDLEVLEQQADMATTGLEERTASPAGSAVTTTNAPEPSTSTETPLADPSTTTSPETPLADPSTTTSTGATSSTVSTTTTLSVPTTAVQTTIPQAVGPSTVPPSWLGTIALPLRPDGYGAIQPTPLELTDRRFPPPWFLRLGGSAFESTIGPVPLMS